MEVKVVIDLSDKTLTAIDKLVNALTGARSEGPWLNPTVTSAIVAEEEKPAKPVKAVTKVAKPAKVEEPKVVEEVEPKVVEEVEPTEAEEPAEIDEATLRAKVSEGSAAGLKDKIKAYLKENFKTLKLADLDPSDYSKVYNAVNEMLAE